MTTVTSARNVFDDITNTIDYLTKAELVAYPNTISLKAERVSWHAYDVSTRLFAPREHPTIDQYLAWLTAGAWSAILFDGSLLQLTYELAGGEISGHRLAYVPCPYDLDLALVRGGDPLADIIELYRRGDAVLRSPIRFDFDARAAKPGHPAAHLTLNSVGCRIACVAPMHVSRFVDFVFRNFYSNLWIAHSDFFEDAANRHIGSMVISADDRQALHLAWPVHPAPTAVATKR
jgi:hypothetical protein